MRSQRERGRYEPLNETHRRVAEEEEKRRSAERDHARSDAAEPEPYRPGEELRPRRPEIAPDHDPNSPEARRAAREEELQKRAEPGRTDDGRIDPSRDVPETQVEREAEAAEYEITRRGEMTDARAARLALLRSIDRDIQRERDENEGKGLDLDRDSGDHSR